MSVFAVQKKQIYHEHALAMLAWGRIWSPLVSEDLQREAWHGLDLPGDFDEIKVKLMGTFHVGQPSPPVPLLLHAALDQDGGAVREAWMRVMEYLHLVWNDVLLPPDHLGLACELFAIALEQEEIVLVGELAERFLIPWSGLAISVLQQDSALLSMLTCFEDDLVSVIAQ